MIVLGLVILSFIIYTIYRRRITKMQAVQERIESELRIARDIQMSMVPSVFPEREGLDMYASMTPAKEVGGDLYGYLLLDDKLYFAVGDVSGKGVPASRLQSADLTHFIVDGLIINGGSSEGLTALDTGAAATAMVFSPLVTRPRLAIIYAQRLAATGNVSFGDVCIGRAQTDVDEGACGGSLVEGVDKLRSAVGIDGMIASVVGHHNVSESVALGNAHGDAEHDAITEGYDGRLHVLVGIMTLGNVLTAFEQGTDEVFGHEIEGDDDMANAQTLAVELRKGNLALVMLRAVVEGDGEGNALLLVI